MQDLIYQRVKTKSGYTGYIVTGEGPPLLMLVGYSGTLYHWPRSFIQELSAHYTLYLIDNRSIGLSESINARSTMGMAEDVKDFIDAMGIVKPYVLGWSMGGTIAQELACICQKSLAGLILMATVPNNYYINLDFMMFMATASNYSRDEFRNRLYYFFFSKEFDVALAESVKINALNFSNYNYRFTSETKEFQDEVIPIWDGIDTKQMQQFALPILLLWAQNDLVVGENAQKFILENSRNATLIEYQNGGHFLIHNQANKVAKDIVQFCDKHKELSDNGTVIA